MKFFFQKENLINTNLDILDPKTITLIFISIIPLFDAGFDNNIVHYALIISLIILIGVELQNKTNICLEISEPDLWLLIFLIFSASSFFWSVYQLRTVIEWLQLFTYFLLIIIIRRISKEEIHSVVKIALISASGIALLGILEYIFVSTGRMISTFTNPNPLATYLMMAFLFTIGVSLRNNKKLYLISIIFGTAFILTGSRGAFLSFIIALPFILLGIRKNNIFKTILKGAALILLSFVFANFIIKTAPLIQEVSTSKTLISSITRIDSSMEVPKSITGRFEFWKVALKLFKHQPIKGFGLGTFFSAYYIEYPGNEWVSRFAHNHYLQTLVELGLVGIGIFFAFLLVSGKNILTRVKNKNYDLMFAGSFAASISFLLHIFLEFSWNFPGAALFFFLMLGIAVGPYKRNNNDKSIHFNVNYRVIVVFLVFVLSLTLLNYTSIEILKKGTSYIEKDNDKALEYIELGNKIYPINSIGYNTESKLYYQKYLDYGKTTYLEKAINSGKKSVELTPYKWDLHYHLGKLYLEKGDNKNAEKELVLAVKYSSYIISPHLELSKLYRKMSMPEKAKVVLLEGLDVSEYAISKAPEEKKPTIKIQVAALYNLLSEIYLGEGNKDLYNFHKNKKEELIKEAFSAINELVGE
jgi:O-antigen ligase